MTRGSTSTADTGRVTNTPGTDSSPSGAALAAPTPESFSPAYSDLYLDLARRALGTMLDYAVNDAGYGLAQFWQMFLESEVAHHLEAGNCSYVAGRSGVELAWLVIDGPFDGIEHEPPRPAFGRSEEYWTGWALAYYQWETALSFSAITARVPIERVRGLYRPYHEMDVLQFADRMDELYVAASERTPLQARRQALGLSQRRLAELSGVPVRTIQQYEQRRKDIGRAAFDAVCSLARALHCPPEELRDYRGRRRY